MEKMADDIQKILIVDDQPMNCKILELILQKLEVNLITVHSGEEALKVLREDFDFDLILMDVQMPGLNGFDTAQIIKEDEKLNDIPIIFITAIYNAGKWVQKGYNLGAYDYMVKPFDEEILKDKVRLFLSLQKNKKQIIRQAEELISFNRSLKILSECNSANLYIKSECDVFSSICNVIIEEGGYPFVWVSEYKDTGHGKELQPLSYDGKNIDFKKSSKQLPPISDPECPLLLNNNLSEPVIVSCSRNSCQIFRLMNLEPLYVLSIPFEISSNHKFFLNIFSDNRERFTKDEIEILRNVAFNLSLIIEYKRAEQALKTSEEKYRLLVETMNEGVVVFNKNEVITYSNKKFSEMLGYECQDISGETANNLFDNEGYKIYRQNFESSINGIEGSYENRLLKSDGHFIHTLVSVKPIIETDGSINGILAIFSDITDIKAAEEKKMESQKIIEKTGLTSSIGVLTGGITHEISQPLNVVKIGTRGVLLWNQKNNNVLPEHICEMLESISEASDNIQEIVQHMKSYWVESSSKKYELFNLNPVIDNYLSINKQKLIKNNINLNLELDEQDCTVYASRIEIEIIINNLLNNAILALNETTNENKQINVKTIAEHKQIRLIVEDNGPGLPDVPEDELFSPFFSTRKETTGTGLGLAIVNMFVKQCGGNIKAQKNVNGGACFTIYFNNSKFNEFKPIGIKENII